MQLPPSRSSGTAATTQHTALDVDTQTVEITTALNTVEWLGYVCMCSYEAKSRHTSVQRSGPPLSDTTVLPCDGINEHVNGLQIGREGGSPCVI